MYSARGTDVVYKRAKHFGKRPRVLYGTMIGTFAFFCLFVSHYSADKDESKVWVWFGMRSDGRCGRDFKVEGHGETKCAEGQCCSSHGWCGSGDEYCSVSLGCQSGCKTADGAPAPPKDSIENDGHDDSGHGGDDDDYYYRSRHYRYGDDDYHGYGRGYGRGHGGYHDHDYHHRYDEDESNWGDDHYGGEDEPMGEHRDANGEVHPHDEDEHHYGDHDDHYGEHDDHHGHHDDHHGDHHDDHEGDHHDDHYDNEHHPPEGHHGGS